MLFLIAIFLGALLLFQIQPLIAKIILPFFGGGAAIWTACLLFFQAFLLLGYLYAHLLARIKSINHQLLVHGVILSLSLSFFPLTVPTTTTLDNVEQPLINILSLLSLSVGLPYLLLSSTGPLVQRWYSLVEHEKLPYPLYSLSNAASLLALLSFPFVIEPWLSSGEQTFGWSVGYLAYVVIMLALLWHIAKHPRMLMHHQHSDSTREDKSAPTHPLLWLALSTLGVVVLVSTTSAMTQNIPPVPFLWILPLCLYLLSFIISFHSPKWYVRWYWLLLFIPTAIIAIFMFFIGSQFNIATQVILYSSILFAACMICHGELARLKPCVSKLTWYYLVIAFGGFFGSVLVAFVAQNIFVQFLEFPIAIVAVFILLALAAYQEVKSLNKMVVLSLSLAVVCSIGLWQLNSQYLKHDVANSRNFYGVLTVKDVELDGKLERRLIDGTTSHGTQSLESGRAHEPLSYYRKNTGVAIALQQFSQLRAASGKSLSVGLIGLGAGTLAAYGQQGDWYQFYELNPAVVNAAQQYFSYLRDSAAKVSIVTGDARVSLTKELAQSSGAANKFDVLVIDAFSGDSIPQHLLTVEAMALYWQNLSADGLIAIHVSNSHLNLLPLMRGLASHTGKELRYFKTVSDKAHGHDTEWVWMTNNQAVLNNALVKVYLSELPVAKLSPVVWRDDFSNLFALLK